MLWLTLVGEHFEVDTIQVDGSNLDLLSIPSINSNSWLVRIVSLLIHNTAEDGSAKPISLWILFE